MAEERLKSLFEQCTGRKAVSIVQINSKGAGGRRYYEITDSEGGRMFGVQGTNPEEDEAFYRLSLEFEKRGLRTPCVYGISEDRMCYLQQYLGTTTLDDLLGNPSCPSGETTLHPAPCTLHLLKQVMHDLADIQFGARGEEVYKLCYPVPSMDAMSVMFDLNYFKYCFVKLRGVEFNEVRLQHDFERLTKDILEDMSDTFLYRDFQARNVMVYEGTPYYIDYQGGRRGPVFYDVASFVWDVRADFPEHIKSVLVGEYLDALQQYMPMTREEFMPRLRKFILFRGLQALGAFGFRGLWEKKQLMADCIPAGLRDLRWLADEGTIDAYPELKSIAYTLTTNH